MQELDSSSLKLYREADGQIWLAIGRMLSLNLTALAQSKGPVWLFQFNKWTKLLTPAPKNVTIASITKN